jgi:hypothetical protein
MVSIRAFSECTQLSCDVRQRANLSGRNSWAANAKDSCCVRDSNPLHLGATKRCLCAAEALWGATSVFARLSERFWQARTSWTAQVGVPGRFGSLPVTEAEKVARVSEMFQTRAAHPLRFHCSSLKAPAIRSLPHLGVESSNFASPASFGRWATGCTSRTSRRFAPPHAARHRRAGRKLGVRYLPSNL